MGKLCIAVANVANMLAVSGGSPGLLKFGFGRDVPLGIWMWTHMHQFLKKKWPIHIPIGPIWG